jgi:hypothetical protein
MMKEVILYVGFIHDELLTGQSILVVVILRAL